MELLSLLQRVQTSPAYEVWKKSAQETFLFSIFMMAKDQWDVIYYHLQKKTTTSFTVTDTGVTMTGADIPLLQQEPHEPEPLELTTVNISSDDAVRVASQKTAERNVSEQNRFLVLQTREGRSCWTVVILATDLRIYRYTIDAQTGELKEEAIQDLSKSFSVERKT